MILIWEKATAIKWEIHCILWGNWKVKINHYWIIYKNNWKISWHTKEITGEKMPQTMIYNWIKTRDCSKGQITSTTKPWGRKKTYWKQLYVRYTYNKGHVKWLCQFEYNLWWSHCMEKTAPHRNKTKPEKGIHETVVTSPRKTASIYTTVGYKCLLNLSFSN